MMYPAPTFVMYAMNAVLTGMRAVPVPLRDDFSFDAEAFIARMRAERPALVFLAYPNNPTGVLYPEADVVRIIEACEGLVVLDEAYHVFAGRTFMPQLARYGNLSSASVLLASETIPGGVQPRDDRVAGNASQSAGPAARGANPQQGWSEPLTLSPLVAGVVAMVGFAIWERKSTGS